MNNNFLQSISLKNFRSWKNETVEFDPGVSIIIGENDNGKTNILRGINWAANNKPPGEDYRSHWGGDTSVVLKIEDKEVGRHRTDKDNFYTLTGYKEPFKSFGQGVPETIKQFLNLSAINIAFQLDGPFLLGKSPSDVARYYNDIVNLDIIDRSLRNIRKTLSDENNELESKEKEKEKLTTQLKDFEWLDDAEKNIVSLEKQQEIIRKKDAEWSALSVLSKLLKEQQETLNKITQITKHERQVLRFINIENKIKKKDTELQELKIFTEKLNSLEEKEAKIQAVLMFERKVNCLISLDRKIDTALTEYNELTDFIKAIKEYEEKEKSIRNKIKFEKDINLLLKLKQEIDVKRNQENELLNLTTKLNALNIELKRNTENRNNLEREFDKIFPDICPLCGKPK